MKIAVACGGTGGHAFPGIAVAEELKKRGHEVVVWHSGRDVESSVMRTWKGDTFATYAKPLSAGNVFAIIRSVFRCLRQISKQKPDVILAMGSYSSFPPVIAAKMKGVKIILHEANAVPGRAIEYLSCAATALAYSFPGTNKYFPKVKSALTGLPVRSDIATGVKFPAIHKDAFTIFVTGGSQGAHAVNELLTKAIETMAEKLSARGLNLEESLYVIHQTGVKDECLVLTSYARAGIPARVMAFEREMANAFASADIVVARAGASTCFELAQCGKPALLIPLPTALRNHQYYNADCFAATGAADLGIQAKLTAEEICRYLLRMFDNREKLKDMSSKMRAMKYDNASAKVADFVEEICNVH
jgi:UDP-N-acetylglucosamine--N-acetylmuramyl-(pentapeptide) pyrophosphoryl-undecaprenol N-acetylglucosamine transferase